MGLFRAQKKEIDYETEATLPEFYIDTNGFVIFRDGLLGGTSVMEIIPHVATESITREDSVFQNDTCDIKEDPDYEPLTNTLFGDARQSVFPPWVYFLNSLQQQDDSDEPTHIQIIAKKCRTAEWNTKIEYAIYEEYKKLNSKLIDYQHSKDRHDVLLGARSADYLSLLEDVQNTIDNSPMNMFDIRKIPTYKVRYFLVISYTPSSEGWWLDGRDTDYYITDNNIVDAIFSGNEEKLIPKLTNLLTTKQRKQEEAETGGQDEDFFWIESDRTAQILFTRTKKIKSAIREWNKLNPHMKMPFHIKHLNEREVAALIAFYPNILTPYWDKIYNLHSDQNDLLYSKDIQYASKIGDASFIDHKQIARSIAEGNIDMVLPKQEIEDFLAPYKDKKFNEIPKLSDEYANKSWSPEKEEQDKKRRKKASLSAATQEEDIWADFGVSTVSVDDEFKTEAQKREEFLRQYKNRSRKR